MSENLFLIISDLKRVFVVVEKFSLGLTFISDDLVSCGLFLIEKADCFRSTWRGVFLGTRWVLARICYPEGENVIWGMWGAYRF